MNKYVKQAEEIKQFKEKLEAMSQTVKLKWNKKIEVSPELNFNNDLQIKISETDGYGSLHFTVDDIPVIIRCLDGLYEKLK